MINIKILISVFFLFIIISNIYSYEGEININSRFVSWGFDDGRTSDFEWVAPLFEEYNFKATFNIINRGEAPSHDFINNVNNLISSGHEIGDHTIFHLTYMYNSPLFNGQPDSGGDGGQVGFPSNDDFTKDLGSGKNIFGFDLSSPIGYIKVDTSIVPTNTLWGELTDVQCQEIRNTFSIFAHNTLMQKLDSLSNQFCGTIDNSIGSWNNELGEYTGGIFSGCKTSANHEIWERLCQIQQSYFCEYFNLNEERKEWSMPGGWDNNFVFTDSNGIKYYDREMTKQRNDFSKFYSTRLNYQRSWVDVLRQYGYQHCHDAYYVGRYDGDTIKMMNFANIFNASASKIDGLNQITLFNRVNSNYTTPHNIYQDNGMSLDEWMIYLYENDSEFKDVIDKISNYTARGTIPYGATDSGDSFTWRLFYTLYIRFCSEANIQMITKSDAYDICFNHQITSGNLFPNPNFERAVLKVMDPSNAPEGPDGWYRQGIENFNAGQIDENDNTVPDGESNVLICDENYIQFKKLGIIPGEYKFSFYAQKSQNSNSSIIIRKIKNKNVYNETESLELLNEININDYNWKLYSINFFIDDAPLVENGQSGCEGLDNKVCGLFFQINGNGTKFTMPNLEYLSPLGADFSATPLVGIVPLTVKFIANGSQNITYWKWDFNNDGINDSYEQNPIYTFNKEGNYDISLKVYDNNNYFEIFKHDYINVLPFENRCLIFDGNDNYINCGSDTSLTNFNELTVSCWINPSCFQNIYSGIIGNQSGSSGWIMRFHVNNRIHLRICDGISTNDIISNNSIPVNDWTNIIFTINTVTNHYHLYFNNNLEKEGNTNLNNIQGNHNILIGSDYLQTNRYFQGKIDEISIWNKELTESQIENIRYHSLDSLYVGTDEYSGIEGISWNNLVAYWKFDEGYGNIIYDFSKNDNNGIMNNFSNNCWEIPGAPSHYYIIPNSPTNLFIEKSGNNIILKWNSVHYNFNGYILPVDKYKIYYSQKPNFNNSILLDETTDTIYIHTNALENNKLFYFIKSDIDN